MFGIGHIEDGGFCLPGGGFVTLQELAEDLPHGSGIDCDWHAEWLLSTRAAFYNSYHAMDENGMYDGYGDFRVEIFVHLKPAFNELRGPLEGKAQVLHYPGDMDFKIVGPKERRNSFFGVKDYLYETIGYALEKWGIGCVHRDIIPIEHAPFQQTKGTP